MWAKTQLGHHLLQLCAVVSLGAGAAHDEVDQIGVSLQQLRQQRNDTMEPFALDKPTHRDQHLSSGCNAELSASLVFGVWLKLADVDAIAHHQRACRISTQLQGHTLQL